MTTTKQLVLAVSHRINNLMQLNGGGEFLIDAGLAAKDLDQIAQGWSTVRRTQNRISQLSVNLNFYCHDFQPLLGRLNLHEIIEAAAREIGNSFDPARLKITHQTADDIALKLDELFSSRAIENMLCVGLMASASDEGPQNEVTLETLLSDNGVLIRVSFRHSDDRFNLPELMEADGEFTKIKGEQGLLELLVSREIVEAQGGTIGCACEGENLNAIEIQFPVE